MLCLVQTGCRIWRRRRSCWGDKGVCKNSYKREFGLCRTSLYLGAQSLPSAQVLFHSAHMLLVCLLLSVSALHIFSLVLWMLMCMRFRYIPKAQESYSVFLHRIPQKQKSFQKLFLLLFCLPLATPLSFLFHPFLHKLLCAFLVLISFGPHKIRETEKIR